jgi:hypothetical protein
VTEKIWRPIVARRPFIVMSNLNYLKNLKRLGFKTFNTFWSEEYDMWDGANRIRKIEELLSHISQWSIEELENKLTNMEEILEHNLATFKKLDFNKINEVFN